MIFKHKCPIPGCSRTFPDKRGLDIHMKEFHVQPTEAQLPGSLESQVKEQSINKPVKEMTGLKINLNRHIFLSGQTQSGKSVAEKMIFDSLPKTQKAIFYDYKKDPNHERFVPRFPIFTDLHQIESYYEKGQKKMLGRGIRDFRVIYRPPRIETDVTKTHTLDNPNWKRVNDLANYAFKKGNVILFIDEIAPFTSPQSLPPALYDCYIMGASRGVTIISVTQRPNVVHNTMISEAYTRILFRQELEADRIKLGGIIGKTVADQLHKLPNEIFIISYVGGDYEIGHLIIPDKMKYIL